MSDQNWSWAAANPAAAYNQIIPMNSSASTQAQIRFIGPVYLYNMLQDFRHLLIFDYRPTFEHSHIRDAFHVHPGLNRDQVLEVIDLAEKKASEKEAKYKNIQRVRRYFFVDGDKLSPEAEGVRFVLGCLQERKTKEDKLYSLSEPYSAFEKSYPFMLVDRARLEAASSNKQEFDRVVLYPYAKFPSEIIADRLYLSGVYSSNSQRQLSDLGIVNLVDFIDYGAEEKMADFKREHPSLLHIPINQEVPVVVDFDLINQQIDQRVSSGRTLLYCKDGETVAPAFAVSYLMWKTKIDVQMATLKVCQAISRVELSKMVYTQLLVYKPKK